MLLVTSHAKNVQNQMYVLNVKLKKFGQKTINVQEDVVKKNMPINTKNVKNVLKIVNHAQIVKNVNPVQQIDS